MQHYTFFFYFCKLLYMFRMDPPPIIRSTRLSTASGIFQTVTATCRFRGRVERFWNPLNSSTIAAGSSNGLTSTRCCIYSCVCSWWRVPPETRRAVYRNKKLCNIASCWSYLEYIYDARNPNRQIHRHSPMYATFTTRNYLWNWVFMVSHTIYQWAQLKSKLQHNGKWSAAAWLPRRLRRRPAVFSRHFSLPLTCPPGKILRTFQKCNFFFHFCVSF